MIVKINDWKNCPSEQHLHMDSSGWMQRAQFYGRVNTVAAMLHGPDVGMLEGGYVNVGEPPPRPIAVGPTFWGRVRQYLSA